MKTKYRLLALLVGLCVWQRSHAQDFSQDWGNYTLFLDQSDRVQAGAGVNEFTGAVSYSFNFYTLNTSGQSFPVSIGYYSNGVKVDEYASCVGLGWNLDAGGSITKITRGIDDQDATKGYQNTSNQLRTPNNVYNGVIDGEKDYFSFSAFGMSGTFYYDETAAAYKPMSGEKITIEWQASPGIFIIRDDAGNAYHFTSRETIYTYSPSMSTLVNTQFGNWFLTKVVLADKKEVSLIYEQKIVTGLKVAFSEISHKWHGCSGLPGHVGNFVYNTYNSYRIKSISSEGTAVNFIYSTTARQDITDDYALEKIEVEENGTLLTRFLLKHDYHSGRLLLNNIVDKNVISSEEQHLVSFDYYKDYTMPAPVSVQSQDVLGYFNNQPAFVSTVMHPDGNSLVAPYQEPGTSDIIAGANREIAAASIVQTLILKKISTLYGKVEEYEYESNKYGQEIQIMGNPPSNAEFTSYGVRVSKVTTYEQTQGQRKYIAYIYKDNNTSTGVKITHTAPLVVPMYSSASGCYGRIRMPNARKTRPQAIDAPVVYKKVKTQVYTNAANVLGSTLGYNINTYSIDSPGFVDETWGGNSNRVFYTTRFLWGKPTSSASYNKNMELVSHTAYTYEGTISKKYIGAFVWLGSKLTNGTNSAAGIDYYTSIGYCRLKSVIKQVYNTDAVLITTSKKVLEYDSRGYVSEAKSYINNTLVGRSTYKRPYNYTLTGTLTDATGIAMREMNAQNIASPVIESISYKVAGSNETVMSAGISLYEYDFAWQIILPSKNLSYKQVSPAQASITALSFNSSGVPSYPSSYMVASQTSLFDDKHNPVEVIANGVEYTAMHFNNQGDLLCTFNPSPYNSAGFLGFEPYEISRAIGPQQVNSNWWISYGYDVSSITTNAFTGTAGVDLSVCPFALLTFRQTLDATKPYVVRYWKKEGTGTVTIRANYAPVTEPGKEIKKENGWVLVEHEITSASQVELEGTATIDDLLLYPLGAGYKYQVFNTRGLKTAEVDASGTAVFYEYDQFDRTTHIKDVAGNVLKAFEYGILEKQ